MNVILTCGGTGGHIYPAIALAKLFEERQKNCRILFMGAEDGLENELVPREGYRLETVRISNFQRSLSPKAVVHNVTTLFHMASSMQKAKKVIREFEPDVIIGTGGYASYPALKMGARLNVPTAVHESNAMPGLTTRMLEGCVDRIMVSFAESREKYKDPDKVLVTGTPVREDFFYTDREKARAALGLDERPLIVSCWGSLGAREMNKKIARFLKREQDAGEPFQHIHATGSFGWKWMPEFVKEQGVELEQHPALRMQEFIYNMPEVLAAADLMICRAGAATISEVCAAGVPCIMVPSPNVTDNHQEKNARVLEQNGAAKVIREADCDGDTLYEEAAALLNDPEARRSMRASAAKMAVADAAERIYQTAIELIRSR